MIWIKRNFFVVVLILLSSIPLITLFHPGLPITHDGQDHVARIANFYQGLIEGNIVPRWAANLNWGYGHPILMFLYPLPSYSTSLIHAFGFSFVDSLKILFGLSFILSGFTMYLWIKNAIGESEGFLAAFLYMFAPYRFVDFYVRGAIGEHVAFIFPPLVLYFLYKLRKKYNSWYIVGGSLSFAGLILSHNAISLMFIPVIGLYVLYCVYKIKQKKDFVILASLVVLFGFLLSAFFWAPAFFEGKYTLRDIVTGNEYASRFVTIKDLLYGDWSYGGTGQFTVQIGIIQWVIVMLATLYASVIALRNKKPSILTRGLLIIFVAVIILMLPISNIVWQKITILQKFQFPWRLLSVEVFVTAVLGGIVLEKIKKYKAPIILVVIILSLFLLKQDWQAKGYLIKPESFYSGIYYSTTDTGESSPIWSIRFMEHTPKAHIQVIDGNASIQEGKRNTTTHMYTISAKETSRIRENTVYFPGWIALVDGKSVPVEFQDPANRGLITFFVPSGTHTIIVEFKDTRIRTVSNLITIIGAILLIGYVAFLPKNFL